jgi:ADP-ribosylglycohydrolase
MSAMSDPSERARRSLEGLSVGDALGQAFFVDRDAAVDVLIAERRLPPSPWPCSDDTVMALAIVDVLERRGHVDQDLLASEFSRRYRAAPERGYGAVAYWLLHQLAEGRLWREVSREVFGGAGSLGNGGAMRVAPLGAFFADDLERVVSEARASAEVTHAHPDGQAGAIAVAIAAALLTVDAGIGPTALLTVVIDRTPDGETRAGLTRARGLMGEPVERAASQLGDGRLVRSSDTVPFALWCAATSSTSYEDAAWLAIDGLRDPESDRDTVLAIVGGVVGAAVPPPAAWVAAREPLRGPAFG